MTVRNATLILASGALAVGSLAVVGMTVFLGLFIFKLLWYELQENFSGAVFFIVQNGLAGALVGAVLALVMLAVSWRRGSHRGILASALLWGGIAFVVMTATQIFTWDRSVPWSSVVQSVCGYVSVLGFYGAMSAVLFQGMDRLFPRQDRR